MKQIKSSAEGKILTFKSIFISDVNLGTDGCQAYKLLEFNKNTISETLY